jgi:glycosyltransferase involved in cell wall biosynthesis
MSVLVLMPTWASASELWLARMNDALGDDLGCVACWEPGEDSWRGRAPSLRLAAPADSHHILLDAIHRLAITRVLVHYIPMALRFDAVWKQCDAKLFVHCHGYDVTWDRRHPDPPHAAQFDAGYPARVVDLSNRAVLIANSHTTAKKLFDIAVPPSRVVVKYLGVPVPEKISRSIPSDMANDKWPMMNDKFPRSLSCLYLGRLVDFKGPDLTIRAFEKLCDTGADARLKIAGDGPLRAACEELRAKSRHAPRIELLGEVDAATGEQLRAEADAFTAHNQFGPITRQEEAFGVAFVEAMAAGLPVVSGRSGSLPEIITHNHDGLLFPPGDIAAHAAALLRLYHDPALRRSLGSAAYETARAKFSDAAERAALREILR